MRWMAFNRLPISELLSAGPPTGELSGTAARNGEEVVIVEVKTTLRPDDVKHFIGKLAQARTWMPGMRNNTLYGAMAYLKQDSNAADMAMNKGLLVIRATGDSASIVNMPGFEAKTW